MQQYQTTTNINDSFSGRARLVFPDFASPPPPQPWKSPPIYGGHHHDPFLFPSFTTSNVGSEFTNMPSYNSLQLGHDHDHGEPPPSDHLRLEHESDRMAAAQEMIDAKALAASKSHNESERRRRERINNHLAKLRSLLPNTTKTDKASLLAEVIQHVKVLRKQTSIMAETSSVPTEADELTVVPLTDGQDRKLLINTSICCDDRSDLLPELKNTLKSLRLRILKAEITTLGGRVKNVLLVTQEPPCCNEGDDDDDHDHDDQSCTVGSIQDALNASMEKFNGGDESTPLGNA